MGMKAWNRMTKPKHKKVAGRRHAFNHHNGLHYKPNFLVDINSARYDRFETTYDAFTKFAGKELTNSEPRSAVAPSHQPDAEKVDGKKGVCACSNAGADAPAMKSSTAQMPDVPPSSRAHHPPGSSAVETDLVVEEYDEKDAACGTDDAAGGSSAALR